MKSQSWPLIDYFDFSNFTASSEVTLQGDASITNDGVLALTNYAQPTWNTYRSWILFAKHLHIGEYLGPPKIGPASFVTSFSFVVNDVGTNSLGDGISE